MRKSTRFPRRPLVTNLLTGVVASVVFAGVLAATGCSSEQPRYVLHGQVVKKNVATNQLTVKNEDIPGFMPPMTMPYRVQDPSVLQKVEVGDVITAELTTKNNGSEYWLEHIRIVNSTGQKK